MELAVDSLILKLKMAIQALNDKSSEQIVKKITKKSKYESLLKSLNNCLNEVKSNRSVDEDSLSNVNENIEIFIGALQISTNDSVVLQRSAKRLVTIIEQYPQITSTEAQMQAVDASRNAFDEFNIMSELCLNDFLDKNIIKGVDEKYTNFMNSIDKVWIMLGKSKPPIKAQESASIKNIEKAINNLYYLSDICYILKLIPNQGRIIENIKEASKKKRGRRKSKVSEGDEVIQHDFSEIFKKKTCSDVLRLKEIPENKARVNEKEYMNQRKNAILSSYKPLSTTFMPFKRIEEEKAENNRLKELYQASLMTKEEFDDLQKENEELKAAIAELENYFEGIQNNDASSK